MTARDGQDHPGAREEPPAVLLRQQLVTGSEQYSDNGRHHRAPSLFRQPRKDDGR